MEPKAPQRQTHRRITERETERRKTEAKHSIERHGRNEEKSTKGGKVNPVCNITILYRQNGVMRFWWRRPDEKIDEKKYETERNVGG